MSRIIARGRTTSRIVARQAVAPFAPALEMVWFPVALSAVLFLLYAPALRFGLIWDDPAWYLQGAGQPFWQLLTGTSTFQFYRPLAMFYTRCITRPDGTINAPLAHALQIGAHAAATLSVVGVLRALGLRIWQARLAGVLFALHPYSYQAVAWQAAHQPIGLMLGLLALLWAKRLGSGKAGASIQAEGLANSRARSGAFLVLSLVSYVLGLLFHESTAALIVVLLWMAFREVLCHGRPNWPRWPLPFIAVTVVYVGVWLAAPRSEGITGRGFDGKVLAYLLQGAAYPITAPMVRLPEAWAGPMSVTLVSMAALVALAVSLHRRGQGREAVLALVLTAAGMAPVWAGLSWEYVKVGSRLLYPAIVGIAALWGAAIAGGLAPGNRTGARVASGGLLLLALGVSLGQWHAFHRLYDIGTRHLAAMVSACATNPGERLVFVNFPDRLGVRRAPYPLGYWGLTLAPVAQDLAEYALLSTGSACETTSISSFVSGLEGREASPYRVDMRGENQEPEGILQAVRGAGAVLITDYAADGGLVLRRLGRVAADDGRPAIAIYGDRAELVDWEVVEDTGTRVRLTWRSIGPRSPGDTIFVHLLTAQGQLARDADGDALGGLLPMETWEDGEVIDEWRQVSLQGLPAGDYRLTIGVYNRITAVRYPALTRDGIRVSDDEFALTTLTARPAVTSAIP